MDIRLYILGGLFVLLLALVVYLIAAMFSYRRAVRRAREVAAAAYEESPALTQAAPPAEDVFARADAGEAIFGPALRTSAWQPETQPPVQEAPASVVQAETRAQAPVTPRHQEPRPPEPEVLEYRMVAPVELHFTEGDARVGVRPGTRTFAEFQRLASALLDDLASHRTAEP
ncbi:MAG: hypothetical protein ABFC80_07625 [Coriobacteriales bacterium]|nr:hypothetical protein [Actinomycetes bacterium]